VVQLNQQVGELQGRCSEALEEGEGLLEAPWSRVVRGVMVLLESGSRSRVVEDHAALECGFEMSFFHG
jgi:hypothetical protein